MPEKEESNHFLVKAYGGDFATDGISDQINGEDFDAEKWSMVHSISSRDVYMHHLYSKL